MKSLTKFWVGGRLSSRVNGFYRGVAAVTILIMLVMTVSYMMVARPAAADSAAATATAADTASADEAAPSDSTPDKAAPDKTEPDKAELDETAPDKTVPDKNSSDEVAADEDAPDKNAPSKDAPDKNAPDEDEPTEPIAPDEVSDDKSEPATSGGVSPADVTPDDTTPSAVSPGAVSPGAVSPGAVSPGAITPAALKSYTAESADGSVRAEFTTEEGITDPYLVVKPLTAAETDSFRSGLASGETGFALGSVGLFDGTGAQLYVSDISLSFDLSKFLPGAVPVYSDTATTPDTGGSVAAPDYDEDEDSEDDEDEDYDDEDYWDDEFYETYDKSDIKTFDPADYPSAFKEKIPAKVYYAGSGAEQAEPKIEYDEARDIYTIDGDEYVRDEVTGGYRWYDEDEGEYDYYYPDGDEDDDYSVTLGGRDGFEGADGSRYVYDPATDSYAKADGTGRFTYDADEGVYYSDDEDYFYYYDGSYAYSADEAAAGEDTSEDTDADADADTDTDEDTGDGDTADEDTDEDTADEDEDTADGYVWHGVEEIDGWPGWYINYDDPDMTYVDSAIVDEAKDFKDRYEFGYGKYFEGYHHKRYVFNGHYYTYDKEKCTYVWDKSYEKKHGKPIVNAFTDHIYYDPVAKKYYVTWYEEYKDGEFDADDDSDYYRDKNFRGYWFMDYWFRHAKNGNYLFDRKLNLYGLYDGARYCWQDYFSGYGDGFYFNKKGVRVNTTVDTENYYGGSVSKFAVDNSARVYERPSTASVSYPVYTYGDDDDGDDDYDDYRARDAGDGTGVQSGMNTFRIIDIVTANGARWAQVDAMVRVPYSEKRRDGNERSGDYADIKDGYIIDFLGYMPADKLEPCILGDHNINNIASLASGTAVSGGAIAPGGSSETLNTNIDGYTATATVAELSSFMLKRAYDGYKEYPVNNAPTSPGGSGSAANGSNQKSAEHARPAVPGADSRAAAERTALSENKSDTLYGRGVLGKVNKPAAEERKAKTGEPDKDGNIGAILSALPVPAIIAIIAAIAAAAIAAALLIRRRYKLHHAK